MEIIVQFFTLEISVMKKNYVDIMGGKRNVTQSQPASLDGYMPLVPAVPTQPTFFTPSSGKIDSGSSFVTDRPWFS